MDYRIIDAHCHIFPEKIADKAVENIGGFYNLKMRQNGRAADLVEREAKFGVEKYIVHSVATTPSQVESINSFICEQMKANEKFAGLITLHPDMETSQIDGAISFALKNGFKGIKMHPDFQKFYIDDKKAYKIYERAEGIFPILIHTGDDRYENSRPFRLANVLNKFKNLVCIAPHFGGYSRWDELDCYKDLPNIYFDTSSSMFKLKKEQAVEIILTLGADRFMFGTDYPMWEISSELNRFFALGLDEKQNADILYNNAVKIYNL